MSGPAPAVEGARTELDEGRLLNKILPATAPASDLTTWEASEF
jgi:hypothetical protein